VPPPRSLDQLPNNLPIQLTSFVGRDRELVELDRLLASTRLLTLAGAGGCGKTRLALQLAADALDRYPGGAWWLELAPLSDPALIESALATMVGVRPLPGQTPVDAAVFLPTRHEAGAPRARARVVAYGCGAPDVRSGPRAGVSRGHQRAQQAALPSARLRSDRRDPAS
jgi:hypothetical protein